MRTLIGAGMIAVFTGCGAPHPVVAAVTVEDARSDLTSCPDPKNCTDPNGTGIYIAEGGNAGIGPFKLMITHFINNGSTVTFQGRYFDPREALWLQLPNPSTVDRADYQQKTNLLVTSVTESSTRPTWTVRDRGRVGRSTRASGIIHPMARSRYVAKLARAPGDRRHM